MDRRAGARNRCLFLWSLEKGGRDEEIIFSLSVSAWALFPAVCTCIGGDTVIGYDDIGMASREGVDRQGRLVPARYIHLFQRKTLVNREKVFVMKKRNLSSIMVVVVLTMGG